LASYRRVDTLLKELRTNAGDEDYAGAPETAAELRDLLAWRPAKVPRGV
jgi:hypothetical protein